MYVEENAMNAIAGLNGAVLGGRTPSVSKARR